MLKSLLFLLTGVFGGLWLAWPGVTNQENWFCAKEIVLKSQGNRTDIRTVMAVSPNYFLKKKSQGLMDKLRVVGDACFR